LPRGVSLNIYQIVTGHRRSNIEFTVDFLVKYNTGVSAELSKNIKIMLLINKKFALALKSFGEGYVSANPDLKSIYNQEVEMSEIYRDMQEANRLRDIIGEPHEPIMDLLIS
jgi:flavorubredoxin